MAAKLTFVNTPPTGIPKAAELSAVLYREYALLARNRVYLIMGLAPMLIYLLLVNTSLSNLMQVVVYEGVEVPFAVFLLPMTLAMAVVSAAGTSGMALFQEEMSGVSTQLWSYPLRRSRFLVGKVIAGVSLVLLQALLALGLAVVVFDLPFGVEAWAGLLAALAMSAVAFNGLYLAAAILITDYQAFMLLSNISIPVLIFSAPSLYTVDSMPTVLQWVAAVNPLTYGINGMRDAAVFGFAEVWQDLLVLAVLAVVSYTVGGRALLNRARNI
ncbi:ABC transporter permease [Nonomuraea sp. ATR24]|uniref:ABC transporter permease n=1 Tax=Nonomuraea TaxID=83681 RepID=UPI001C5D79B4|nr:ABC transporter permease [Nonomuraea ceibae]